MLGYDDGTTHRSKIDFDCRVMGLIGNDEGNGSVTEERVKRVERRRDGVNRSNEYCSVVGRKYNKRDEREKE